MAIATNVAVSHPRGGKATNAVVKIETRHGFTKAFTTNASRGVAVVEHQDVESGRIYVNGGDYGVHDLGGTVAIKLRG